MSVASSEAVYGLTPEEQTHLESEDEEFFGEQCESEENQGSEYESDQEEVEEQGIIDDIELETRILRASEQLESDSGSDEEGDTPGEGLNSSLITPDSDPLHAKLTSKIDSTCSCSSNCLSQFTVAEVYSFILSLREMTKTEKDMLILGKLHVLSRNESSVHHANRVHPGKRKRVTCDYHFDYRSVCKDAFILLHDIGTKQLKNLQKHLRNNGPIAREHGLIGCMPATTYPYSIVSEGARFIRNYAEVYGIPQPAARSGRAKNPPIYLPASQNYMIVHSKYVEACQAKDPHARFLKYKSFTQMWKKCLPDIVFMTPRSDVCATCENFRYKLRNAINEEEKIKYTTDFSLHIIMAQQERDYYLDSMKKSEAELAKVLGTQSKPKYAHYTFDFAEQVHIPHHSRQVGPIYFKVCRKIQLFGICCDSNRKQINYLIDEDNSIGFNGSTTHGPNSVISMLDHYFTKHSLKEEESHLHCDNCVGQNKNNYVIGYLAWRIIKGKHKKITLSFMRVGHTRCLVDGHFGLIKKIYRQSETDTLDQMAQVVRRSSANNIPQLYDWRWREWDIFFLKYFKKIPGITKYQHFRMHNAEPGIVYVRKSWNSSETKVDILKQGVRLTNVKRARTPSILPPAGLTPERKKYLYEQIRQFVNEEYQDITCPEP